MIQTIIRDSNDRINDTIQAYGKHIVDSQEQGKKRKKGWYNEGDTRVKIATNAKAIDAIDIWCAKCKKDYKAVGYKCIRTPEQSIEWGGDGQIRAWYEAKCRKGHECIRLITDKHLDPYYRESILLRNELQQMNYEDRR
jgi:hypothetical protein